MIWSLMLGGRTRLSPGVGRRVGVMLVAASSVVSAAEPELVRVGERSLRLAAAQRRLDRLGSAALSELHSEPAARPKAFIESVLVPELLLGALGRKDPKIPRRYLENRELQLALERELYRGARVSADDVQRFYELHRGRWQRPRALLLQRILVRDEATARGLISKLGAQPRAALFAALAREHSLDSATAFRHGSLGYVQASGHTDAAQVVVRPALFAAAARVEDGQLVPDPVSEGDRYAVVWRRGARPEQKVPLAEAWSEVEVLTRRETATRDRQQLLQGLRDERVRDVDLDAIERVEYAASEEDMGSGVVRAPHPAQVGPAPVTGPWGER